MPISDYRFNQVFSKIFNEIYNSNINNIYEIDEITKQEDSYIDFLNNLNIECGLIGGYADFIQTDPREYDNKDLDECIIKIDSNLDSDRIIIGDSGIAWLLISKQDLVNKKFENALFDWDCC